jgi:competence protein ComEC
MLVILALFLTSKNLARIGFFLIFVFLIFASATRFKCSSYDQTINNLAKNNTQIFHGVINETSLRSDGSKKLLVNIFNFTAPTQALITLYDSAAALSISPGQNIIFKSRLSPMTKPLSPVHFDAYRYGLTHTIHARGSVSHARDIFATKEAPALSFGILRQAIREKILEACTPHQSAILLALILGETSLFVEEQKELYQSLGAQHLLAVSGLQVTLIATLVFFLLVPLFALCLPIPHTHRSYILAALITFILLWFFVALCQWPKSAVRAALMSTMMLLPIIFSRPIDLFDALFGSGLLCLLADPLSGLDIGFLLSYSAVFGLLVAHQASAHIREKIAVHTRLGSWFFALFISSCAAFLATLPIIAYFFGTLSPLSALANLVLVPMASFMQVPAILFSLLGISLGLSWLIKIGAWCASIIELIAESLAQILGSSFYWPALWPGSLLCFCAGLFLFFIACLKPQRGLFFLSLLLIFIMPLELLFKNSQSLEVRVLPVGQGDSSLFSFSNGQHMLIDAGGQIFGHFDPGLSIVVPTLNRHGIKILDVLVITHPDPDHILGAFAVLDNIIIKEIWHSGFHPDHPLCKRLLALAQEKNITIKTTHDILGAHYFGSSLVEVLAPKTAHNLSYEPRLSANNNSLVLKITHDNKAFLWPGDIEEIGENLLIAQNTDLSASILKAPHHGSKTSSTPDFISRVNPKLVIYSTGVANKFNFPHEEVSKRYENHGTTSYNTALDGEIIIRVKNNKLTVSTFVPKSDYLDKVRGNAHARSNSHDF